MRKQEPIDETIIKLTELIEGQQRALNMANNLLDMKGRLVELCEEEVEIYKRHNKSLHRITIGLSILIFLSAILHIIRP